MGRIYKNENQLLVVKMLDIYGSDDLDWMSYQITKKNILTFHHIIPVSEGGLAIIENGALITKVAHKNLNILEYKDIHLFDAWNQLFIEINKSKQNLEDTCYRKESKILKKYTQQILYK